MTTPREHVDRLTRRLDHLDKRIQAAKTAGKSVSFDLGEAATLRWALELIREQYKEQLTTLGEGDDAALRSRLE